MSIDRKGPGLLSLDSTTDFDQEKTAVGVGVKDGVGVKVRVGVGVRVNVGVIVKVGEDVATFMSARRCSDCGANIKNAIAMSRMEAESRTKNCFLDSTNLLWPSLPAKFACIV